MMSEAGDRSTAPTDKVVSLGDVGGQIGFRLRLAQVAVFNNLIGMLRPFDLRPTDFSVLVVIGETPKLKQQSVGRALNIQRSNLVPILDQLEKRGLIRRSSAPDDRRSKALTLTPEGATLLAKAKIAHNHHVNTIATTLEGLDSSVLVEALTRLAGLKEGGA